MSDSLNPAGGFPHPVLTPLPTGMQPTAASLRVLKQQLYANALSVHSELGGAMHGHLALLLTDPEYLALTNHNFDVPVHPGRFPNIPANATNAASSEITRRHVVLTRDFLLYSAVNNALRLCILAAVPAVWLDILADEVFGHANNTPLVLLTHLTATYGRVRPEDLTANWESMLVPWSNDRALEELFTQHRNAQLFALPHDAISNPTSIRYLLINLANAGGFDEAIERWDRLLPANQTLADLHTHFTDANQARLRAVTVRQAGFAATAAAAAARAPALVAPAIVAPVPLAAAAQPVPDAIVDARAYYYCWTHGLGTNSAHTSASCTNRGEGHRVDATLARRRGGSNSLSGGGRPRRPHNNPE